MMCPLCQIARLVTWSEGHAETGRRVSVRDLPANALELVATLVDERLVSLGEVNG